MYNFFVDQNSRQGNCFYITGPDYNHIKNVLRMREDDEFLVSCDGISCLCKLESIGSDSIAAQIIEENFQDTELPVKTVLFQGLPKSDKMELIIQKTVELGVSKIVPVEMKRCVVKLDDAKKAKSKLTRWQTISESAAKQSKRSIIPSIGDIVTYNEALQMAMGLDILLVPYENKDGMAATKQALDEIKSGMTVGIIIGPEGGFEDSEIEKALQNGAKVISLGKRILRTETAAITTVGMCMLHIEMNLTGEEK